MYFAFYFINFIPITSVQKVEKGDCNGWTIKKGHLSKMCMKQKVHKIFNFDFLRKQACF